MKKRDNAYKFADEFMKFMANSYDRRSDYTSMGYKQSMKMFLVYAEKIKRVKPSSFGLEYFTYDNLTEYMNWMRYEKGLSPQTCNLRMSQIIAFLKFVANDPQYRAIYMKASYVARFRVAVSDNVVGPLSKDAILHLIEIPGTDTEIGLKYTTMLTLLYSTATRISEILSLKISDIFLGEPRPYINVLGKGNRFRRLTLVKTLKKHLKSYIQRIHGDKPNPNDYLFFSRCKGKNEKCSTRSVNKQINVYLSIARKKYPELPVHIHTHQFRHSMATHLIDDGVNVFCVSKFLGHKSVSTTMKYIGITPKMTEKAIAQIESTSLNPISPKWKTTTSLADLIK
jgi:site-specific recombinase XerD